MSSPGQKRGNCGHAMASFDGHAFCAHCREKGKGEEPCIANKDTFDCKFCNLFTSEQRAQISTPSYKLKKEKREAKRLDNPNPTEVLVCLLLGLLVNLLHLRHLHCLLKRNQSKKSPLPKLRNLLLLLLQITGYQHWTKNGQNVLTG